MHLQFSVNFSASYHKKVVKEVTSTAVFKHFSRLAIDEIWWLSIECVYYVYVRSNYRSNVFSQKGPYPRENCPQCHGRIVPKGFLLCHLLPNTSQTHHHRTQVSRRMCSLIKLFAITCCIDLCGVSSHRNRSRVTLFIACCIHSNSDRALKVVDLACVSYSLM